MTIGTHTLIARLLQVLSRGTLTHLGIWPPGTWRFRRNRTRPCSRMGKELTGKGVPWGEGPGHHDSRCHRSQWASHFRRKLEKLKKVQTRSAKMKRGGLKY